jgi:hypothetical protein
LNEKSAIQRRIILSQVLKSPEINAKIQMNIFENKIIIAPPNAKAGTDRKETFKNEIEKRRTT